jgi:acyl-[acyl-carrier-protein] desaturase
VLRHWKLFDLEGLSPEGEQARHKLAEFMEQLDTKAARFEEKRAAQLTRRAERQS